ncbi:MAG: hypothetical protein V8Q30_05445 [Acutalibacteraceae bacterium]
MALSVGVQHRRNLPENDLAHLFDRFYRADSSRNSETGGYGWDSPLPRHRRCPPGTDHRLRRATANPCAIGRSSSL